MSYDKSLTLAANTNDQVLFESHPNDSRVTGPVSVAPTVSARFVTGGNNTPLILNDQGGSVMNMESEGKVGTLRAEAHGNNPIVFEPGVATRDGGHVYTDGKAPTLRAEPGDNFPAVAFAAGFKPEQGVNARSLRYKEEQAPTLTGNTPGVVYGIAGNVIDRQVQNGGNGVGVQENISYTLNTIDRHAVCIGNGQVAQARIQEKVGALNCMHDQQAVMQSLAVDGKNFVEANVNGPLMSSAEHNIESNNVVRQRYAVRRLTPLECERLQGLPDGYTLIDDKSCSDSARYKALGNGMAQPCADFVLKRIAEVVR